jgi:sulfopyruvate decarboxylase subunit beta
MSMSMRDAVRVLHDARGKEDAVVPSMGAAREWMLLGSGPRDLVYVPSSMGQATAVGLGLALAQPARRVVVLNGDGSMLMNLGSLVSITAAGPENLVVIITDNGTYEVTGAQPTPGSAAGRVDGTSVDFVGIARGCGFRSVHRFASAEDWESAAQSVLETPGPSFVVLDVDSVPGTPGPRSPGNAGERGRAFREALALRL